MSFGPEHLGGPYETVFDVGAFRGDFARACRAAWPEAGIYSFEPLEPRPRQLDAHWWWQPVALGPKSEEEVPINRCEFIPSSSFLQMTDLHKEAFPYTRQHEQQTVKVHTVDSYAGLIHPRALLKLDVQGYEYQVLLGAQKALERFHGVVSEVSWEELYEGEPSFATLDSLLSYHGFRHAGRVDEMPDPRNGKILQSDELWLRS